MKVNGFIFIFTGYCFGLSCVTPEPEVVQAPLVAKQTIIETKELAEAASAAIAKYEQDQLIRLPSELVDYRKVERPRADLREGPGAAYFLEDKVLAKGDAVIVIDRYFRWRKVVAVKTGDIGWVHEQTLAQQPIKEGEITIKVSALPALFTAFKIKRVYDYNTSKAVKTQFPKGSKFYRLKKHKNRYLILIEKTMSVAWINEGDVI